MQLPFELLDEVADAASHAVDGYIGHCAVKRIAHHEQLLDLLHRIGDLQQGSIVIKTGALEQQTRCGVQINNYASLFEYKPIFRTKYGATASGNDQFGLAAQLGKDFLLAVTKALFALDVENQWNSDPGPRLDLLIGIDKGTLHASRQLPPDRGLARARHADEIDIAVGTHR